MVRKKDGEQHLRFGGEHASSYKILANQVQNQRQGEEFLNPGEGDQISTEEVELMERLGGESVESYARLLVRRFREGFLRKKKG